MLRLLRDVSRSRSPRAFAWRLALSLLATIAFVLSTAGFASAAPRDKAALKKIDEALTTHYLNMDFDAAEGVLVGTIRACEDKCSGSVVAKAWMYVGIVKGAGRNDLGAALDAFKKAIAADPGVQLDDQVATDQVKATFAKAKGGGGGGTAAKPPPAEGGGGEGFTCTPAPGSEVETRRPVPLSCEADADLKGAKLHFKAFGGQWTTVKMEPNAGEYRATIPCSATQSTGKLRVYVEGFDNENEVVARFGTKESPQGFDVVSETTADPPAFPGEEPPQRCSIGEPGSGGGGGECGSWGEKCGADGCCKSGLTCTDGTCESSRCESDSDCKNGATCENGKCTGGEEGEGGGKAAPYKKNWVGLHFAMDLASISSDKACSQDSRKNDNYACFYSNNSTYEGFPNPNGAGTISGGFTPSTMRVMVSFERLFGSIGLQARLGFAFNGGLQPKGGTAFFPIHAEARVKYWVLGSSQFSKKGFRPWIHLGGGMAQVDAVVKNVDIADCGPFTQGGTVQAACLSANPPQLARQGQVPQGPQARKLTLTAQKQLGTSFITIGGGFMYAIGPNHGPVFNLNFMLPVPSVGFVIEPSLGYEVGF